MKIIMVKTLGGVLKCTNDADYEKLKVIKAGKFIEVDIRQKRNLKFHKKFFALIKLVFDNQEIFNNQDHLRKELVKEAGFYELYRALDGTQIAIAKSISFGSMSESEFSDLYNRVLDVVVKYFHFDKQEIMDEIERNF